MYADTLALPAPADVVVIVDGVGDTDDCWRNVGEVKVLEEEAERVGEISRSGCRDDRLF